MGNGSSSLSISEVAAATGIRPSALRYYEDVGLISSATRIAGRRHYAPSVLRRLAIVALCQEVGFTIREIRHLFGSGADATVTWRDLVETKLTELDARIERAQTTRKLLQDVLACGCGDPGACEMVTAAGERRLYQIDMKPR